MLIATGGYSQFHKDMLKSLGEFDPNIPFGFVRRVEQEQREKGRKTTRLLLLGDKGSVHMVIWETLDNSMLAMELGCHSPNPIYEGHIPIEESCQWLEGLRCYFVGVSLVGAEILLDYLKAGPGVIWNFLIRFYKTVLENELNYTD